MFMVKTFVASLFLAIGLSTAVGAATLSGESFGIKEFEIYFDDSNNNRKLDLSEFTGWKCFLPFCNDVVNENETPFLVGIYAPQSPLSQLAVSGGSCPISEWQDFGSNFCTVDGTGHTTAAFAARFYYVDIVSPVPLPAGLPLVLTGLAGLAGLRMRHKRKAQV